MSKKDQKAAAPRRKKSEKVLASPDPEDKKAPTKEEKLSPPSGETVQKPEDNPQHSGSVLPEQRAAGKVDLDLEGLEELTAATRKASPHSESSKRPEEKVELDLEGLAKKASPTQPEVQPRISPEKPETGIELNREKPEVEAPADRPEPPPRVLFKDRKWSLMITGPLLIALLLGASWFIYKPTKTLKKKPEAAGDAVPPIPPQEVSQPALPTESYHFYRLSPFLVPIPMERGGRERFLKVTAHLAFKGDVPSDEIAKKLLMIRSDITEVLLRKTLSDFRFPEGKTELKREIKDLLNASLTTGTVQTVYFEEFVVL